MKLKSICLSCLLLAAAAGVQSAVADVTIVPALPDLKIANVHENGPYAWVEVHNSGALGSGACSLRVWHWTGAFWLVDATVPVPPVAKGTSVWVFVYSPGIAAPFNNYRVDAFNVVLESNEANNSYHTP